MIYFIQLMILIYDNEVIERIVGFMYLRNGLIGFLKVKNIILLILGIFFAAASASNMAELTVYYFGDWYTIINAESTPGSIALFLIGVMMIICSRGSRRLINDACFFSSYFEGDLNGYVDFAELAEITGKTTAQIKSRIALMQLLYMKNFKVIKTVNYRYPEIIELYSKTVTCSCRSCGGWMEKRVYFTGMCPYCGSSDLTAQVVSGQRVYFINDNANRKPDNPDYYKAPSLNGKRIAYAVGFGIALFFVLIFLIVFLNFVSNYNNEAYLRETLLSGRSYSSFELIRASLMNVIIFSAFGLVSVGSALVFTFVRMLSIENAQRYARRFAQSPTPFISISELAQISRANSPPGQSSSITPEWVYKKIVKSIKEGYLRGCSPEKHGGMLRIALAKQIVKDRCPGCGAPIVGAVTENYSCRYCGRIITGVIRKQ